MVQRPPFAAAEDRNFAVGAAISQGMAEQRPPFAAAEDRNSRPFSGRHRRQRQRPPFAAAEDRNA